MLPTKNILLGISVICAVLFFVNVWRRTWLLPSVRLALLAVSRDPARPDLAGIVSSSRSSPCRRPTRSRSTSPNITATRAAYDIDDVDVTQVGDATIDNVDQRVLDTQTASVPLVDPKLVSPTFEQVQQGPRLLLGRRRARRRPLRHRGSDRALVLGVRELDQSGVPDGDQNWTNLTPSTPTGPA